MNHATKARRRTKEGDVFAVPISKSEYAIGQILRKQQILFVTIFYGLRSLSNISDVDIDAELPVISLWTMDAKLYNGNWIFIENKKVIEWEYMKLNTRVLCEGETWVQDFESNLVRRATSAERTSLPLWTCYSPAWVERIVRNYHNREGWNPEDDAVLLQRKTSQDSGKLTGGRR